MDPYWRSPVLNDPASVLASKHSASKRAFRRSSQRQQEQRSASNRQLPLRQAESDVLGSSALTMVRRKEQQKGNTNAFFREWSYPVA